MTSSVRSILDKPLCQLTEDDISQLTREDCRKFLKDKGMRRPSWNKSQAIQQVISLKALLEGTGDDSDAAKCKTLKRIVVSSSPSENPLPRGNSDSPESGKEQSVGGGTDMEEVIPSRQKNSGESAMHIDVGSPPAEPAQNVLSPRKIAPEDPLSQMTIFYRGKVNVYEKVSPDKARAIMLFAASPIPSPHNIPLSGSMAVWSFSSHMQASHERVGPLPPRSTTAHGMSAGVISPDLEGQHNRKVSLQKYFDKKKDRVKFKSRKELGATSSGLEMFVNPQIRVPVVDGQLSRSTTGSSPPRGCVHGKDSLSFS
ncbi:hypothetical protein MLD38_039598 [Melastoma candidum]|uniref:Uncharacterized protein n=1 Tax=Melastoma candidum TaxID=119954 RepID=A0ACB9L3Z0_9MYRT|nr:hypothetical protein MLD38_039598 [Melastoma candidum]